MPRGSLSYDAALDFIMHRELFGVKLGLTNISLFLKSIGNPQNSFKSIHIAGTNGKGSTAAFIESIMREAGYKIGIFTSPHLVDYRERIRVASKKIDRDFIADFVRRYRYKIDRNNITFFETCTALTFCYLAEMGVDIGIIEVGLGGRLDATNILMPELSVITDISYDHTNILGKTLKKIAFEKAGIIKPGIPVVTGLLKPEAKNEIKRIAKKRNAPYLSMMRSNMQDTGKTFRYSFVDKDNRIENIAPSLPGKHQVLNSALAVKTVSLIGTKRYNVSNAAIRNGIKKTEWPGRFEIVRSKKKPTLILDVGHNPAGIKAMVATFKQFFPGKKADIVVGFVRGKKLDESVRILNSIAKSVEVLHLNTHRSADPREIKRFFGKNKDVTISVSVINSVRKLFYSAAPDDIIIICGSHYAVGEFMEKQKLLS